MSRFKRLSLEEAAQEFPSLNEETLEMYKGGCKDCEQWKEFGIPIFTFEEYETMVKAGEWQGGAVCGLGYILPEAVVYGNNPYEDMFYCLFHQLYFDLPEGCYGCYQDHYPNHYGDFYWDFYDDSQNNDDTKDDTENNQTDDPHNQTDDPHNQTQPETENNSGMPSDDIPNNQNNNPIVRPNKVDNQNTLQDFIDWFKYVNYNNSDNLYLNDIISLQETIELNFSSPHNTYFSKSFNSPASNTPLQVVICNSERYGEQHKESDKITYLATDDQSFSIQLKNDAYESVIIINCTNKENYDYVINKISTR